MIPIEALQLDPNHPYQSLGDYPQMSIGSENLQIHNLTPQPNTEHTHSSIMPLKRKGTREDFEGETTDTAANKERYVREPTALPQTKKSRIHLEVSESSNASSQKDVLAEKALKQSLDMPSQQGVSIEIRPSATASERVSPPPNHTNLIA